MKKLVGTNIIDKKELFFLSAYYIVLLLIAMSWTEKTHIEPRIEFRIAFTFCFIVPLLRYYYWAPMVLTVFTTIRAFSVAPFGYLPSDAKLIFYLTLILIFSRIIFKNYDRHVEYSFNKANKGLIALIVIALLSNILNMSQNYYFLYSLGMTIILIFFIKSRVEIRMMEIAFIVITFCLSIYAFIFSQDFAVKDYVSKEIIERSYWTDPNYLGSILDIGIIISLYYFLNRTEDKIIFRVLYLVTFIMGCITIGLLASRGAFLATIIPTLYMLYKRTNSIKNLAYVTLFVIILVIALSSSGYFDGLYARFNTQDTTGSSRTVIWTKSFLIFLNSDMPTLLFGGGTDYSNMICAKAFGAVYVNVHNNFLAILYDYGVIGLIVFLYNFYFWLTRNLHNVIIMSLLLYFVITCLTLVPLMFYQFFFLLILFEICAADSELRTMRQNRMKQVRMDEWRVKQ